MRTYMKRGRSRLGASARTVAERETRRQIVAEVLAEAGHRCARCGQPATEVHEPASRGRYPGSHLDKRLCVASCGDCNRRFAVLHPDLAEAEGWLLPSGLTTERAVELTARWKRVAA